MMDSKWTRTGALGCCLLVMASGRVLADENTDAGNPYGVIAERNVFHLNPPPPPEAPPEAPKADLPVIKITGIVKIGDKIRALFVSQPKNNKDAPTYFNLADGEREGILEVVKIHMEDQKVDIVNSGTAATLTMKDDSLAKNEGEAPAAAAGPGPAGFQPPGTKPNGMPFPAIPNVSGAMNRRIPAPSFPGMVSPRGPGNATAGSPYAFPQRTRRLNPSPGAQ